MVFISKIFISDHLSVSIGLQKIYGLNSFQTLKICHSLFINPWAKMNKLLPEDLLDISEFINENYIIQMDKKKEEYFFQKKYLDLKNYKGLKLKLKRNV